MNGLDNGGNEMLLDMKLEKGAPLPKHAQPGDAGIDLTTREDATIYPHTTKMLPTGVHAAIPRGYVGLCISRSGIATKKGLVLANGVGVIDSGYRGEIMAPLHNISHKPQEVKAGERICQMVILPFMPVTCRDNDSLDETERGADGFGSTGEL